MSNAHTAAVAVYAVLNSHDEPMLLAPTRAQCQRYIDTQSPCADLHVKAYPFQPTYDPATGRLS